MAMSLIQPSDRFFVAGARGMAGRPVRALSAKAINPAQGELLMPSRQELNLLDDMLYATG